MTYNVTYLMFDAIYQVQTFAMLFSSGDFNECEVRSVRFVARDWTLWPGVGQSVAIQSVNPFPSFTPIFGGKAPTQFTSERFQVWAVSL
jgi:hypothetical protein